MKLRTQFVMTMVLFGLLVLIVSASVIITNREVERLNRQEEIARNVVLGARELSSLSSDYLLYRETQQRSRWEARLASFSADLSNLNPGSREQGVLLDTIKANQERLQAVFSDVASTLSSTTRSQPAAADMSFVQVSWSRMEVQNQGMVFDASRLAQLLREQADQLRQRGIVLNFTLIGVFGVYFVLIYLLTFRGTLKAIADLQAGTRIIGSGNLDFAIEASRADEIGELSRAFNRMAADLKDVTASQAELEREIAERKKAEDRANQQKAVQEGINRILQAALTCDTEEELGHCSLAVAEQLTGSRFGFVTELCSQGGLKDIAVSDPGWELCRIDTPLGHGRLPRDMTVRGLHGRVLRDGKAFFTNDPSAAPDHVGTPDGHPPLTAFLGVPLTRGGKTLGMIGLGNRDGGYRAEDQEAAESLAASIVEAFERLRAEEEIRQLNESLSQRAAELEVSNTELEAFAYSVSHDLRAPLRAIDGFGLALLEDCEGQLGEEGQAHLRRVRAATQRMGQLIDDLLQLSRVTRAELRRERVDLSRLAEEVADELRAAEGGRGVHLVIQEGLSAVGDPILLRGVLENLLGNAWKFTRDERDARIEVGTARVDGETAMYVRDNGAGFDMAYAGKLFGAFQRLHSEAEFPGSGIGLATVQRIVRRHGGRVWAESAVGQGATFYLTLQLRVGDGEG